jgi:hypothetical protein
MLRRTLAAQAVQFRNWQSSHMKRVGCEGFGPWQPLLQQFAAGDEIKIDDLAIAADLFLSLVLSTYERQRVPRYRKPPKDSGTAETGCGQTLLGSRQTSLRGGGRGIGSENAFPGGDDNIDRIHPRPVAARLGERRVRNCAT